MCEHLCVLGINFSLVLYTANVFLPALAFADTQHLSRGISVFRSCSSAICTFASLGGNRVLSSSLKTLSTFLLLLISAAFLNF